ncbi:MAG: 50S ribosomal protein L11 [Candidatus Pacearchaeota archaeon]
MIVKLLVEGGAMTPGPALAQKLGPMGINIGQVISDVNKATISFKGIKVPVELDVNPSTKTFVIRVSSPPVAELIKKEMKLEKGAGDHKNKKVGNISIEQIISIAKTKLPGMLEKDLKAAVKTIAGSCVSLGLFIESKDHVEFVKELGEGKYDKMIKDEKTELSPEKKKELDKFFNEYNTKLEAKLKAAKEEEEKASTESEKSQPAQITEKKIESTKVLAGKTTTKSASKAAKK